MKRTELALELLKLAREIKTSKRGAGHLGSPRRAFEEAIASAKEIANDTLQGSDLRFILQELGNVLNNYERFAQGR